jgi:hypothetical protein
MTPHFHLSLRLRMGEVIPFLPLYAFMAWTGTALPFRPHTKQTFEISEGDGRVQPQLILRESVLKT